jgi:hypothetical protein
MPELRHYVPGLRFAPSTTVPLFDTAKQKRLLLANNIVFL